MKLSRVFVLGTIFLLANARESHALTDFSPGDLSSVSQEMVHDLISTTAVGAEHRAYMPASSMGLIIGLDIGVEATAIRLPNSFKDAIATASNKDVGSVPALIPIPKLNMHKGLPFAIDVGMSYISYLDKVKMIGGDIKWAFTDLAPVIPLSAALRLSYTSEKLWYINASTWQTDLLVSKDLFFIEPYVGTGLQFWSGNLDIPTGLPAGTGLPTTVSANDSGTNVHFFAGLPIKLALFHITFEADYSTTQVTTFGTKFSFNF